MIVMTIVYVRGLTSESEGEACWLLGAAMFEAKRLLLAPDALLNGDGRIRRTLP